MSDKIQQLEAKLRKASDAYYSGQDTVMSDQEFDKLRDELEELDPQNSFLAQVGAPSDGALTKVRHTIPMGSLKKITKESEFKTWLKTLPAKCKLAVELKLDGLSIELLYKGGKFVQAITRGDGIEGEDVTHTIKNAKHFPRKISSKADISVRCEALLSIQDWQTHFSDKANPRNAASGLVRRSDAKGSEHISCIAFDVQFNGDLRKSGFALGFDFKTQEDRIRWLTKEKFITTPCEVCEPQNVLAAIKKIEDKRDVLPFEIDGAVVKLNSIAGQQKMGEHNGRPYWARAWKFAAMGAFSVLRDVDWSVGTQGTINPVGSIDPVQVAGATIRNVTLHNMDEIQRLGLQIGDKVEVIRAGDVIPKIVRVVAPGKKRTSISVSHCPICKSKAVRDGVNMVCSDKTNCGGVHLSRIKKWISKRRILHLGDSNLESMVNAGVVKGIPDLYSLTIDKMKAGGVGEGMAKRILPEIDKSRNCSLADLIGSLSMDLLGRSQARILIENGVDTLGKWEKLDQATIETFPGFKTTKARRIAATLRNNWSLVESVAKCVTLKGSAKPKAATDALAGLSFCFTGTMANKRSELETMVTDNGGSVRSVSKSLDYLVIADPDSQSSKAKTARKHGVTLISEDAFLRFLKKMKAIG